MSRSVPRSPKLELPHHRAARAVSARQRAIAAWAAAEQHSTSESWDSVADAYAELIETCSAPSAQCRDDALAMAKARNFAFREEKLERPRGTGEPLPIPPRVEAAIIADDRFVELAPSDDPEIPGMRFLAASAYNRYGWAAEALPRLEAIVREHAASELAEYAANMLLDRLNRSGRYADMERWIEAMLADEILLASKPELRDRLERLRGQLAQR